MGHSNTKGNKKFLKGRYTAHVAKGERLVSAEFQLTFRGHKHLSVLVRTAQIPEMTREDVEDYGPNGIKLTSMVRFVILVNCRFSVLKRLKGIS